MEDKYEEVSTGMREEICQKVSKSVMKTSDGIQNDEEAKRMKENGSAPECDGYAKEKRRKAEEAVQLMYGVDLLIECARALKYSSVITALACTIFHRFYISVSPRTVSPIWATSAALLLSGKHENVRRRLRDVANVVHSRLVLREGWSSDGVTTPLDYYGAPGYVWKQSIVETELKILAELGFRIRCDTPHILVLVFVNTLREKSNAGDWLDDGKLGGGRWRALLQRAWGFANDVMRIPACVAGRMEDVACACVQRAAREEDVEMPRQWEAVFGAGSNGMHFVDSGLTLLYDAPPLRGAFRDLADVGILDACQHSGSMS